MSYSVRTLRLFRTFANVLLLEVVMAVTTFGAPAVVTACAYFGQSPLAACLMTATLCCVLWYPIATNLLIMCYVRPYRHAVVRILRIHTLANFVRGAPKVDVSGAYHVT